MSSKLVMMVSMLAGLARNAKSDYIVEMMAWPSYSTTAQNCSRRPEHHHALTYCLRESLDRMKASPHETCFFMYRGAETRKASMMAGPPD